MRRNLAAEQPRQRLTRAVIELDTARNRTADALELAHREVAQVVELHRALIVRDRNPNLDMEQVTVAMAEISASARSVRPAVPTRHREPDDEDCGVHSGAAGSVPSTARASFAMACMVSVVNIASYEHMRRALRWPVDVSNPAAGS